MNYIEMLTDTLNIMSQGYYVKDGRNVKLKLNKDERKAAKVFLPKDVYELEHYTFPKHIHVMGRCGHGV